MNMYVAASIWLQELSEGIDVYDRLHQGIQAYMLNSGLDWFKI